MIGILGAMDVEVDSLKAMLENRAVTTCGPFAMHQGTIYGREVAIMKCGIGKVSAAAGAAFMTMQAKPDILINTGIAGGLLLGKGMKTGDIAIADRTVHHDADARAVGAPIGSIPGQPLYFECDKQAADLLYQLAQEKTKASVFRGVIGSADSFVADSARANFVREHFQAIAVEMEGAAIGQVAHMFGIPYAIVRAISDGADEEAAESYANFEERAAQNAVALLCAYIQNK